MGPSTRVPAMPEVRTTEVLQQVTSSLVYIEERLASLATSRTNHTSETVESEVVHWLDDEDLTGRLQGILRRQARRHGIDLSQ